jgi:broad specificity phosphatase PhoE
VSTDRAAGLSYVTLICQGPTRATRLAAFPADDPLESDPEGVSQCRRALRGGRIDAVYRSPAASARETAAALNLQAVVSSELRECDFGRWRGLRLNEVQASEPAGLQAWLSDLSVAPHEGESLQGVGERANQWLRDLPTPSSRVIAITNSVVIRQLILGVLAAPASSFWRLDVSPWSCVELTFNGVRWAWRTT